MPTSVRVRIYFRTIDEGCECNNDTFGLMFSGIFGVYSDGARMPEIWKDLRLTIGDYLYSYWPDRFKFPDVRRGVCSFSFDGYPRSEQVELLRACEAMLRDSIAGKLDPVFRLDATGRQTCTDALQEFIRLARQELAAADRK